MHLTKTTLINNNISTVEPLIQDPPRKGQLLYKGHFQYPQKCICNTFLISEKGTEYLIPKCPLLGRSTV